MKARQGEGRSRIAVRSSGVGLCLSLALLGSQVRGQDPNLCDVPGEAPDLIVSDITGRVRWGSANGITAFSFASATCNTGSCWANWKAGTPDHPLFGENLFRLKNGRFEQVGQSWLFHAFFALSGSLCSSGCLQTSGDHLGVNCSNVDAASYQGSHTRLGPKFEVDPSTGAFPFPATDLGGTGGPTYKRLQVHDVDLDPALNPGASYVVEMQIVSRDDSAAAHQHNNASYRPAQVFGTGGAFDLSLTGATVREQPAIAAWRAADPGVVLTETFVPGDGVLIVGARVTPAPAGWHYEYAVQNLDSHRSVGAFEVPLPPGAVVTNIGFHDVDYHSGEPFSPADWSATVSAGAVVFETATYAQDPNANALRWGTLYNFRFDCDVPPASGPISLRLFLPGAPSAVVAMTLAPDACGSDTDGDSHGVVCDCDDSNPQAWSNPGEARDLSLSAIGGAASLHWMAPAGPGSSALTYDLLRSTSSSDFTSAAECLVLPDPASPVSTDAQAPPAGGPFFYLVRAKNACPDGQGTLGTASSGLPRQGRNCP